MAGIKEIRTHINSVQQTLKITNAMYLISSSKLRKARQQLNNVEPYFLKITSTISDILHRSPEIEHIYFDKREDVAEHKVGFIVITGDKGLAGAYNPNVLRLAEEHLAKVAHPTLFLIGQTGRSYFAARNIPIDGEFMYTAQDPTVSRARDIADTFIRLFRTRELDEVYVVYTEMVSPVRLEPKVRKLLPLDIDAFQWEPRQGEDGPYRQTVTYVPSADRVLSQVVPAYVKGTLFGTLVESFCSEQNARMTAMDTSTDNARDMLKTLSLRYNRARQAAITQEITEIVGGAQAKDNDLPQHRQQKPVRVIRFLADGSRA
ncbi:ATP synthase F1 subunit gamma [Agathobaculum sp. LCP25S3_E8]|uniref:ATP synthase F1 subunit gamma n=1 Tax=Agathobaculum sp. LCP25S3_E8 TaxID=3438735 RepID=UPI003F8EE26C